jgi:alpha-glucuronidase
VNEILNEDGYELWLRYRPVSDPDLQNQYQDAIKNIAILGSSPTIEIIKKELRRALSVILGCEVSFSSENVNENALIIGTMDELRSKGIPISPFRSDQLGKEGYSICSHQSEIWNQLLITGTTERAILYGSFHFLRLLLTHQDIQNLNISSTPRIRHRILAHWDNIDGSIERGYAGTSLWNWEDLPDKIDLRYEDYARACASIGLNGT